MTIYRTNFSIGLVCLVVFITLKLLDLIDWSWVWVLSPLWVPPVVALGLIIIILLGVLIIATVSFIVENVLTYFKK